MPEIRQNLATKEWVIIATERAKRPEEFKKKDAQKETKPEYVANCPFCPGNESKTPQDTFRIGEDKWRIRVIPNKFGALSLEAQFSHENNGIVRNMSGFGFHEVVIETQKHNMTTALLELKEIQDILLSYRERYNFMMADERVKSVIVFKNHGESAGTSLEHPHSQIIALPMVPLTRRQRVEEAMRYYDDTGKCVYCFMLNDEIKKKERVIYENEHFVGFIPYAACSPFHTWILPKEHKPYFGEIRDDEIVSLADVLKTVLKKLYVGIDNPDFNYVVYDPPCDSGRTYTHWYISIVPRLSKAAGFELGSGMYINTSLPEASAKFLRETKI